MSAASPLQLSIVTICFNDFENLQRTMESIEMQHERGGWEHILVDGASSDGTADWYASAGFGFPHILVSEPDEGIYDAMNKSLGYVRGDYIIFMNAGDKFADAGVIGRVLQRIQSRPAWGYSKARVVDIGGNEVRSAVGRIPYSRAAHLFLLAQVCFQTVVMRVDFLRALGGFDLSMGHASEYHLLIRAAARERPVTWNTVDAGYLAGGVSDREVMKGLWLGHRCRVDALAMTPFLAHLDSGWTALQVSNIWVRKKLKPYLGPAYKRLRH
jgi:glycosyltransferase involved in cell wall biosynthesis